MKRHHALAAICLCGALLAHAAAPGDLPITVQGAGPYYKVTLPIAAYGQSPGKDLDNLRVHNAAGQSVPFAWVRNDSVVHTTASRVVPLFALPISGANSTADDSLAFVILTNGALQAVKKTPAAKDAAKGAVNDWLMDTSQIRGQLLQAHFEIAPKQFGLFALQLQASDDLKQWRNVGGQEQLVRLQHDGQAIERLTIDLGGIQSRFMRLRWLDAQHSVSISKVTIDSVDDSDPPPAIQWTGDLAPEQCGTDYCDYLVPSGAPVSSLKVSLGQSNTLAPIQLFGIAPLNTTQQRALYRTHNPLYALRHQHRQHAQNETSREFFLTDAVVYKLSYPEGEVSSEPLQLNGAAWEKLRLRTNGPIASLGATPPKLSLAVPLKTLVFLGQGNGPYAVAWADSTDVKQFSVGTPVALATLLPNYKPELLTTVEQGTVAAPSAAVTAKPVASTPSESTPNKRFWLWGALLAGLLLLGGMAWSLLSGMSRPRE